jgi:hypothetical protein
MPLATDYLVGPGGARLIWADGRVTQLPERTLVRLERRPRRIIGALYPLRAGGGLGFEAPDLARVASPGGGMHD